MNYLEIARGALAEYEKDERDEKGNSRGGLPPGWCPPAPLRVALPSTHLAQVEEQHECLLKCERPGRACCHRGQSCAGPRRTPLPPPTDVCLVPQDHPGLHRLPCWS